jgi:4-carboxymuconolactone decarboxylase
MPYQKDLFDKGIEIRREVLGRAYVDNSLARADDFLTAFQNITTEMCWGYVWARGTLDRRTRSFLNLGILTALSKPAELKLHVKGAIANGVSEEEIREALLHATVYCGIPAGLEAFKAAHEALTEIGAVGDGAAKP